MPQQAINTPWPWSCPLALHAPLILWVLGKQPIWMKQSRGQVLLSNALLQSSVTVTRNRALGESSHHGCQSSIITSRAGEGRTAILYTESGLQAPQLNLDVQHVLEKGRSKKTEQWKRNHSPRSCTFSSFDRENAFHSLCTYNETYSEPASTWEVPTRWVTLTR